VQTSLLVLTPAGQVVVADAPGWRSSKGADLNAAPIQQLFLEREATGDAPLESLFVTVMVPHRGASPVRSARLLPALAAAAVAVEVRLDSGRDLILLNPGPEPLAAGGVSLQGHFGLVRQGHGAVADLALIDGVSLVAGPQTLRLEAAAAPLAVTAVEDRTFVLAQEPGEGWRPGAWFLAGDTGYEIEAVAGRRVVVRDYPAMSCKHVRLLPAASMVSR
jgi:hypothetical protein